MAAFTNSDFQSHLTVCFSSRIGIICTFAQPKAKYNMIKEKILSNIKTIREAKDLSGEYLAAQMGITQATYSRKEKGEIDFSLNDLLKVSEVLEVPVARLMDRDLAKVITQTNSDNAMGVVENLHSAEGYKVAIETQKEEIAHLRAQVDRLMEKLG
jgi:transcriptional regulator with XRE-family HTH domain